METLKEKYYQTAIQNIWKIKELQVLNNLRSLRQISQLEYDEKIQAHPDQYAVKMRHMDTHDNIHTMIEIADTIDKNLSDESISQIFGIWQAEISSNIKLHYPSR